MEFNSAFWQRSDVETSAGYRLAEQLEAWWRVSAYGDGSVMFDETDRERMRQAADMLRSYERMQYDNGDS
jgi:hypothetical protein